MKQLLVLVALVFSLGMFGQDSKEPKLKFQGGLWVGTNGETSVLGIPAAKFSATFAVNEKTKVETGLTLIPGVIIDEAGERLGLSAGGTLTIRKDVWKLKPVIGAVFVKTDTWQLMPGIGFVF